jgi:transposase, IS6 family
LLVCKLPVSVYRTFLSIHTYRKHTLYRSVDSKGNTIDWMLSRYRNKSAAKRFFKKILSNDYCKSPRVINVDKAKSFPPAFAKSKATGNIPKNTKLRAEKYMNNIQEQDHRFIKRRIRQSQWFQYFDTARKTISGYEAMHMIRKGQVKNLAKGDAIAEIKFINSLFGVTA